MFRNYTFISLLSKRKKKGSVEIRNWEMCVLAFIFYTLRNAYQNHIDASISFVENQSNLIRNVLCLNFSKTRNNYKENDVKSITKLNNKRNFITGRFHYHHHHYR